MRLLTRATSWHSRIERARKTLANVEAEIKAARIKAKGGDLSALTAMLADLNTARSHTAAAELTARNLMEREQRKKEAKA